ncbi:hypothetical protein N1851_014362 [Merluccius polli]|uniref:Uncharacterized protein n=2 Tax=Merluccius polli TaxID=89951 RepID=A0AA47MTN7_MERPO|nr:hypothetical protein N1851_014362 [Merluccius polli]
MHSLVSDVIIPNPIYSQGLMETVLVHFSVKGQLNCHVCDKVGLSRLDKHLADLHQLPPDRDPPCDEDLNTGTLPTPTSPASQRDPPIDEDKASLELEESDSEEPEVGRPLKRRVVKRKLSFFGAEVEKSGLITGPMPLATKFKGARKMVVVLTDIG